MRRVLPLFGASCCCLVLGIAAANAESPKLSDADLDRVTAGNTFPAFEPIGGLATPTPLFPPPSDSPFDIATGLLNPPAPVTPPTTPPTQPPPDVGTPAPTLTVRQQNDILSATLRARYR